MAFQRNGGEDFNIPIRHRHNRKDNKSHNKARQRFSSPGVQKFPHWGSFSFNVQRIKGKRITIWMVRICSRCFVASQSENDEGKYQGESRSQKFDLMRAPRSRNSSYNIYALDVDDAQKISRPNRHPIGSGRVLNLFHGISSLLRWILRLRWYK